MKLTVAELFAGVGGFRVGLNHITKIDKNGKAIEKGKFKFVWANQFEPSKKVQHAFNCYTSRFGSKEASNEDINLVDKNSIPDHNLLVGGFPCQDYSVARSLSNEKGIEGKKGVLFWDIKDVLIAKNTPFVLLENVDRLLKSPSIRRGRDFAIMLKTFDDLGYNVNWCVINAAECGLPQRRRRVFIFAYKKTTKFSKKDNNSNIFFEAFENICVNSKKETIDLNEYKDVLDISSNYKDGKFLDSGKMKNGIVEQSTITYNPVKPHTLGEIVKKANKHTTDFSPYLITDLDKLEKWKYLKGNKKIERTNKVTGHTYFYSEGSMSFPDSLDLPARTMLTSESSLNRSSHIIYDEKLKNYRTITPIEAELIQMFPANWTNTMPLKSRYFMMGNALVTGVISMLEPVIRKIMEKE